MRNDIEKEKSKWYTAHAILQMKEGQETEWLWDKYIPSSSICGITGPSDTGKSTLLRQLAISVVIGEDSFLGNRLNPKHKSVIYISTEDSPVGLKGNMYKQFTALNPDEAALKKFVFLFDDGNIFEELQRVLERFPVDLVIIDSMGDTFEGNANDFVSVRQYLRKLKFIVRKYSCSVLLLHHNVKNSEKGVPNKNNLNGSQGLEAKMRSLFELRLGDSKDERLLTILKGNYVSQADKSKSRVLKLDEESMIYVHTDKEHGLSAGKNATKYDKDLWINRFNENAENLSIVKNIELLREKHKDEDVPGKTWFVENVYKTVDKEFNKIIEQKNRRIDEQ